MVDLGITFGDQTTPGVEVILPDPTFIVENADRAPRHRADPRPRGPHRRRAPGSGRGCKAPIYATPFTAFVLREKLREAGLLDEAQITEVPLGGKHRARARSSSS